jgi:hypothetical protein
MGDTGEISERTLAAFSEDNLQRLSHIARDDLQRFIDNAPAVRAEFASKVLCVALCQGAALHYVDRVNGVKDIDIYTFFAAGGGKNFPRRPVMSYDFGSSQFGRHPDDLGYSGRRVDCLGKSIAYTVGMSPIEALRHYLRTRPTRTGCFLAQKAAVIIDPLVHRGEIVWP